MAFDSFHVASLGGRVLQRYAWWSTLFTVIALLDVHQVLYPADSGMEKMIVSHHNLLLRSFEVYVEIMEELL